MNTAFLVGFLLLVAWAQEQDSIIDRSNKTNSEDDIVTVHIISHSHDDVGWLLTPEGYYNEKVKEILTRVVASLKLDPARRFTQTEIYYFSKWWDEQGETVKKDVRKLVKAG